MTRLDATTVASLGGQVATPGYDRSAVRPGIVHLGVGGSTARTRRCTWTG